jgi:hypothetical protein
MMKINKFKVLMIQNQNVIFKIIRLNQQSQQKRNNLFNHFKKLMMLKLQNQKKSRILTKMPAF